MSIKIEASAPLIQVYDMPTSVAFYRDVLGFALVDQSSPGDDFDWGWLRLDDADLMLNTAYEKRLAAARAGSCAHRRARRHRLLFRLPGPRRSVRLPALEGCRMRRAQGRAIRNEAAVPEGSGRLRHLLPVARLRRRFLSDFVPDMKTLFVTAGKTLYKIRS